MNRPEEQLQRTIADWLCLVQPDALWWLDYTQVHLREAA